MHAWNLLDTPPEKVVNLLQRCGINLCRLAFVYHGGRMLLPRNPRHRIYEHDQYSTYFPANRKKYTHLPLKPHIAPEARLLFPFLETCQTQGMRVYAWTVLLHSERLAIDAPQCCIQNIFGDRYTYALCPAHPDVRAYVLATCQDVAAQPGISGIELEALGHMGYAHNSTHNKSGLPLPSWAKWLLSICYCDHCRQYPGAILDAFERTAQTCLTTYFRTLNNAYPGPLREALTAILGESLLHEILHYRHTLLGTLLDEIREITAPLTLDIRATPDILACNEKIPLYWNDLSTRVDAATLTFFGSPLEVMQKELQELPHRPFPVTGGMMFHYPDCLTERDFRERLSLLRGANMDGYSFYSLGMATHTHLQWLSNALGGGPICGS